MSIEFSLWMGDIKPWMTETYIQNSFSHFGFKPKSIKLLIDKKTNFPLNYCFINFDSFYQANEALNKLKGVKLPNSNFRFKLNWANKNFENCKSVYVGNIPLNVSDSELYNFFKKKYESVLHATIIRENIGKKNYGFVYINKENEYQKCLEEMNGIRFYNSIINVKERKKKNSEEKKIPNIGLKIKDLNDIKSYYPKKKEIENLESIETNSSSEEGHITINGMSNYKRDEKNSNSAIVVTINKEDFGSNPLDGIEYQRKLERKAYELGNGFIPVQLYKDYNNNIKSTSIGEVTPNIKGKYTLSNLNELLPQYINESIKEAIPEFNKKIKGFSMDDAILSGIESRTSSPVIIERNEELESIPGLYPAGEGAGFAGGITTSAVDGLKIFEKIIEKYMI